MSLIDKLYNNSGAGVSVRYDTTALMYSLKDVQP